ncbi:MAG: CoA-binding protein [Deltaproteobacteria bacterium]|nr:CoA-binding protein [Deltaproteobacteria bacterium]
MNNRDQTLTQIDELFHARSVAIAGLPRGMKTGKLFLMALLDQGFKGPIYPVNPGAGEIDGLKTYPSVADIPGPVDLVIVLVPHHHTLAVVRDCVAKGVKGIVLFTSGYLETGTTEGARLQDEILHTARAADIRLIGPNGMGLYCP